MEERRLNHWTTREVLREDFDDWLDMGRVGVEDDTHDLHIPLILGDEMCIQEK